MPNHDTYLSGVERSFEEREIIVSKTDVKGRITYANNVFLKVAGYELEEVMGKPHNLIRHPDMPRCVFKLLWDTLADKKEIFAYVLNRCKNGDHYWVLAHVTPSYDSDHNVIGYHSNRRVPRRDVLENTIIPLYDALLVKEREYSDRKAGMAASTELLINLMHEKGVGYDELILSL